MSVQATTSPVREVLRRWRAPYALRLGMLGALRRGAGDPAQRVVDGAVWRTSLTPQGPATQRLWQTGEREVESRAWGPGAEWLTAQLPDLLGARDDLAGFDPSLHPLVAELWRRYGPLRFPATGRVLEVLVPAILEQRVTGMEAKRAWQILVRAHGEPAPGPAPVGMRVPPAADRWRRIPSWEWHRAGVERARSDTVLRAAAVANRLEECAGMPGPQARARLQLVRGIGVWTAAETAQRAFGDADAVSYGDFHVPADVVYALTGETDGTDERLAEVLAPWPGHGARVTGLVMRAGISRPKRGPRYAPLDFRYR